MFPLQMLRAFYICTEVSHRVQQINDLLYGHKDLTDCAFGCYNERLVCRKPVHVFIRIALGANIIHELSPDIVAVLDGPRREEACA